MSQEIKIRKLNTEQERFQAERLLATSFLHDWNEKEAQEAARKPNGDVFAAFGEDENMISATLVLQRASTFEGKVVSCPEFHMIGTLPEARGAGAVRTLLGSILREHASKGELFAVLIPFSFAFYRKYGFEVASEILAQEAGIEQFASFRQEFEAEQILSQKDVDEARQLYTDFMAKYNLADLRSEEDWKYRGSGEFGERSWEYADKTHYSYLFRDGNGKPAAYFTFALTHGADGPFTGTMRVTELIFNSPEALCSVFGFFYGMRAKITDVSLELPRDVDLSLLLPECDSVKRRLNGYFMARILNVDKVLAALRQPKGEGKYSIHVVDRFLPENTGTYDVSYRDGRTMEITRGTESADLDVTVETLCQMAVGLSDLGAALYREGTILRSNRDVLEQVFVRKPLFLR